MKKFRLRHEKKLMMMIVTGGKYSYSGVWMCVCVCFYMEMRALSCQRMKNHIFHRITTKTIQCFQESDIIPQIYHQIYIYIHKIHWHSTVFRCCSVKSLQISRYNKNSWHATGESGPPTRIRITTYSMPISMCMCTDRDAQHAYTHRERDGHVTKRHENRTTLHNRIVFCLFVDMDGKKGEVQIFGNTLHSKVNESQH